MSISEQLRAAKALIDTPDKWCQGKRAASKDGFECPVMHEKACKFCSKGALYRLKGSEDVDIRFLEHYFSPGYVMDNDLGNHETTMELWDMAVAKAEAEEAQ